MTPGSIVRGAGSEREADAGRAARRGDSRAQVRTSTFCRSPITRRRSVPKSEGRCRGSATMRRTPCSCSTSRTATNIDRRSNGGWQDGGVVVCDRYLASSVAYGEAQALDPDWLLTVQKHLPQPSLTVLLDIPPDASLQRKQRDRDRYEQDLALLARVRDSYIRQSAAPHWVRMDGLQPKDAVTADVAQRGAVATRAAVIARTSRAPAASNTCAQASSVAPVVVTSSTSTTTLPGTSAADPSRQAQTRRPRSGGVHAAVRSTCGRVDRVRRSERQTGMPKPRAQDLGLIEPTFALACAMQRDRHHQLRAIEQIGGLPDHDARKRQDRPTGGRRTSARG